MWPQKSVSTKDKHSLRHQVWPLRSLAAATISQSTEFAEAFIKQQPSVDPGRLIFLWLKPPHKA